MARDPAFKCDACGKRATHAVEGLLGTEPYSFTVCDDHIEWATGGKP